MVTALLPSFWSPYKAHLGTFEPVGCSLCLLKTFIDSLKTSLSVIVPPDDYLPGLAQLCKDFNVLLVIDEIQTGLGRCGYPLYHMKFGIKPDLVILGKGLGGGKISIYTFRFVDSILAKILILCSLCS